MSTALILLERRVSHGLYKQGSERKSTQTKQLNKTTDFCCRRKFAFIAGGFRQTVITSFIKKCFDLQVKKNAVKRFRLSPYRARKRTV